MSVFERHWVDPTVPLAAEILEPAHGVLITSATLRDTGDDNPDVHWQSAEVRTGALHLALPPRAPVSARPFAMTNSPRIFIVTDVARRRYASAGGGDARIVPGQRGGGLGLFTAVRALRDTEARIAQPLADAGISLYAQHVDRLDTGALVDLFRAEENACLLGTDALRDGVDVPGRSLRLWCSTKCRGPNPQSCTRPGGPASAKAMTIFSPLPAETGLRRLNPRSGGQRLFCHPGIGHASRLLAAFPEAAPVNAAAWRKRLGISASS